MAIVPLNSYIWCIPLTDRYSSSFPHHMQKREHMSHPTNVFSNHIAQFHISTISYASSGTSRHKCLPLVIRCCTTDLKTLLFLYQWPHICQNRYNTCRNCGFHNKGTYINQDVLTGMSRSEGFLVFRKNRAPRVCSAFPFFIATVAHAAHRNPLDTKIS